MQKALRRLIELKAELEHLRETTARVLAESEALMKEIESPSSPVKPAAPSRASRSVRGKAARSK